MLDALLDDKTYAEECIIPPQQYNKKIHKGAYLERTIVGSKVHVTIPFSRVIIQLLRRANMKRNDHCVLVQAYLCFRNFKKDDPVMLRLVHEFEKPMSKGDWDEFFPHGNRETAKFVLRF